MRTLPISVVAAVSATLGFVAGLWVHERMTQDDLRRVEIATDRMLEIKETTEQIVEGTLAGNVSRNTLMLKALRDENGNFKAEVEDFLLQQLRADVEELENQLAGIEQGGRRETLEKAKEELAK